MRATPLTPAVRLAQKVGASFPMGVMAPIPVTTARRRGSRLMACRSLLVATQDDGAVVPAQAQGVGEGDLRIGLAGGVGHVVERQLGIGMPVVDGRRDAAA